MTSLDFTIILGADDFFRIDLDQDTLDLLCRFSRRCVDDNLVVDNEFLDRFRVDKLGVLAETDDFHLVRLQIHHLNRACFA